MRYTHEEYLYEVSPIEMCIVVLEKQLLIDALSLVLAPSTIVKEALALSALVSELKLNLLQRELSPNTNCKPSIIGR